MVPRVDRQAGVFFSRLARQAPRGELPNVEAELRAMILAGDQPPGTRLLIALVAEFFEVSTIPVREALKSLVSEGLVEHRPHGGYRVTTLTHTEILELYDVRDALETAALPKAAELATEADHVRVQQIHEVSGRAFEQAQEHAYYSLTRRFHSALLAPSGMTRLLRMYESAWNLAAPARPMGRVAAETRARLRADHEVIAAAFIARDAAALVTASRRHYANLRKAIGDLPAAQKPPSQPA
jgi:DNA-binding GntR family transcriptional regulator